MVLIENITDISFNINTNGIKHLKFIFNKNVYNNEIHIREKTYKKILINTSTQNIINLYQIILDNSYISIFHDNEYYKLKGFLLQKKTLQTVEKFIVFNIVAYKTEKNSIINWNTIFDFGKLSNKIVKETLFKKYGTYQEKSNYFEYYLYCDYVNTSTNLNSITLKKIFGLLKNNILLPYSSSTFRDENLSLVFYALIKPLPSLLINSRLNNNNSQLINFNNFTKINIDSYDGDLFDKILNNGIITTVKSLRITDNNGENISLEVVPNEGINSDLYRISYDSGEKSLDVSFNVFSFNFTNNFSRQYFGDVSGSSIQLDNKILINPKVNKNISDNFPIYNSDGQHNNDFKDIYIKSINGENNHLKLNILGINEEMFDYFNLEDKKINFTVTNNFNFNIDIFFRNMMNIDNSGALILSDNLTTSNSEVVLKKEKLFSNKLGIDDGILELYLKVLDTKTEYLIFNGTEGSIIISTLSSNLLFNNIIMDEVNVKITGIANENSLLINKFYNDENNIDYKLSNANLSFGAINDDFFYKINFRPLPNISINKDISENLYYDVETVVNGSNQNNFIFTRLNHFDNSIDDKKMERVIIYTKINENNGDEKIIEDYKIRTNGQVVDISATENNTYNFNLSHVSNKGSRLRFFSDITCNNELINTNNYKPLAETSDNIDPGFEGAFVKLKMPMVDTIDDKLKDANDDNVIPNVGIIYYTNKFNKNRNLDNYNKVGKIYVNKIKDININRFIVSDINTTNNGILNYNPVNYDILSTKYNLIENEWKDLSFNIEQAFISKLHRDLSFNFNYGDDGTLNRGKLYILNNGIFFDKQIFISSDISFHRSDKEITKIVLNHKLENSILNISFVDCSPTNGADIFNNGKLQLDTLLEKDVNKLTDASYNYYATLNNNNGDMDTFFFESYEKDYSGNIYLLASLDDNDNKINFCQVKLYNQYNYNERTNYELLYKINFEDISGTSKIYNGGIPSGEKTVNVYKGFYENDDVTDICNNLTCKEIIINKKKDGSNIFKGIIESPTVNFLFKNEKVKYGIGNSNIFQNQINNDNINYNFLSHTSISHKIFIVVDNNGKLYLGDDNDNYILLTNNSGVAENFKLIFSIQDISGHDSEEAMSYNLKLEDKIPIEIKDIFIRNVGGLRGSPTENSSIFDLSSVSILKSDLGEFTSYLDSNNNGVFSETSGKYIGLNENDSDYSNLLNNNKWWDISGITGNPKNHINILNNNIDLSYANTVDTDKSNDISGGKQGFWFVVDLSQSKFVDQICLTGTSDLESNPKSFYVYGSDCSGGATNGFTDPSQNNQWILLNRFSYIEGIYNYEINKSEYNSENNFKIFRDLSVYIQPPIQLPDTVKDAYNAVKGNVAKPFRFYRIHIFENFGSNVIKINKIEFFLKSTVMKNIGRQNINYSTLYLNSNNKRNSSNSQETINIIEANYPLISDHTFRYDADAEQVVGKSLNPFGLFKIETDENGKNLGYGKFVSLAGGYENIDFLDKNNYYKDLIKNNRISNSEPISNLPSSIYTKTYFTSQQNTIDASLEVAAIAGLTFTLRPNNIDDILQTITVKGIIESYVQDGIVINDISGNIKKIYIFAIKVDDEEEDEGDEGDEEEELLVVEDEEADEVLNDTNMYTDFNWELIDIIDFTIHDFITSPGGIVKKWVKNTNNYNSTVTHYRIVISENFGEKYIYFDQMVFGMAKNLINRREQISYELCDMSYNTIKEIDSKILDDTGFFDISFKVREISKDNLLNKEILNEYSAYNDISLNNITTYLTEIGWKNNASISSVIIGTRTVLLNWDFDTSDIYVDIKFNIYRKQSTTDSATANKKILLAETRQKYFYDYNAVPYLIANYYVEPVIIWNNQMVRIKEKEHSIFVCNNNNFPYGRYNVRADNPKLFKFTNGALSDNKNNYTKQRERTGSNCIKNSIVRNPKTTILFKNTNVMSKKQLFSMLSKGMRRPFR